MASKVNVKKEKKMRKTISVQIKQEIIEKHERGIKTGVLVVEYGLPHSTIATIIQQKDKFKAINVNDSSTRVFKGREMIVEMERLLMMWIREKKMLGESVSSQFVCDRARQIFEDLKRKTPRSSGSQFEEFKASKGWYAKFKKRTEIKSAIRQREVVRSDKEDACKFKNELAELMESEGCLPQQVFIVVKTGLFWKKMPRRTYITMDEIALPGHKPMQDRLTLLLSSNVSGDLKLKPMLVYHSDNPRVFRQYKVVRGELGVFWKSNLKAWVTRQLFYEWASEVFCPSVKAYLTKNKIELKVLLLLDNAFGFDPEFASSLNAKFSFIRVKFLPSNTTSLTQPIDQVISNLKRLYIKRVFGKCHEATSGDNGMTLKEFWMTKFNILEAVRSIVAAWQEVSSHCLKTAWRPHWQAIPQDLEGLEDVSAIDKKIVSLGESMGLEVDKDDVEELVQSHNRELTSEDLQELEGFIEYDSGDDEQDQDDHIPTSEIEELLSSWNTVKRLMSRHPAIEQTELLFCNFEEKGISYFKNLLTERKKLEQQTTLDCFFRKKPKLESSASEASNSNDPSVSTTPEPVDVLIEGDTFHKLIFSQPNFSTPLSHPS